MVFGVTYYPELRIVKTFFVIVNFYQVKMLLV